MSICCEGKLRDTRGLAKRSVIGPSNLHL